ncbi:MAG: hypothetical protein IRY95_09335, partial [Clostridia bacterium]|nr:hypothetical protein [Clostridia bacterium]
IWDMPLPVAEKLRRLLENHAYGIASNARVIGIFFEEEKELPPHVVEAVIRARRQYNERFIELYRQGVAEGVFADRDPAVAVATLLGACNWCYRWFDPDGRLSAREVAALVAETLMQGVLVRPPAPVTHQAGVPAEPQGRPPST